MTDEDYIRLHGRERNVIDLEIFQRGSAGEPGQCHLVCCSVGGLASALFGGSITVGVNNGGNGFPFGAPGTSGTASRMRIQALSQLSGSEHDKRVATWATTFGGKI